jgi:uncharacterized protein (DUF1800 family)
MDRQRTSFEEQSMSLSRSTMSAIRFGYGIRPGEPVPDGPEALLAQIDAAMLETARFPEEGISGRWKTIEDFYLKTSRLPLRQVERREAVRPLRMEVFYTNGRDQHARVAQAVFSPHGFFERLATFWTDHFAISARQQRPMYLYTSLYEAEIIRQRLAGRFADLLRGATTHPAMLIYLDQVKSAGPNSNRGQAGDRGLNENLGRELLELHTLGVGSGYSQADVRAAALILTGLNIEKDYGRTEFRPNIAEPGPIELPFLGKSYGRPRRSIDDIHAFLDDLAAHPATARHICSKLAIHFVADDPPAAMIEAMVEAWTSSGGVLKEVYGAMLRHPDAWRNPGRKARQPFDYVVAGLRAAGLPESEFSQPLRPAPEDTSQNEMMAITPAVAERRKKRAERRMAMENAGDMDEEPRERVKLRPIANPLTVAAIKRLGQPVWEPASPEGTEEAFGVWISSSQLTGRIEWAQRIAAKVGAKIEPLPLAKTVLRDAARDDTLKVVSQAPSRQAGLALLLASPEFNRR